jgi:4-hydroxymandelate oxidase
LAVSWLDDLEYLGAARLPDYVAAYFRGWAGDGECLREGLQAWQNLRLRPTVLHDATSPNTATSVLGTDVSTPILVAPMAQQVAAHPDGELATAQAAAAVGTVLGVSTNTAVRFDAIQAVGAPWWFQVYVMRDRTLTHHLVERAVSAGARALVLTVDTTSLAPATPGIEPVDWPAGPDRARLANLTTDERAAASRTDLLTAQDLTLDIIGELRDLSGLPIAVKGVLGARDARRCVDAGADAIIVSTHGGRRCGVSITSTEALPEVVTEIGAEAEVHVDSGIRAGHHVAAALALGARAVHVGRPVMWGLAAHGPQGAQQVLERLHDELLTTMLQFGVSDPRHLNPGDVRSRA